MQIEKDLYFLISPRKDSKKPVGVYMKDLKLNLLKKHPIFQNEKMYSYILTGDDKLQKLKISQSEISNLIKNGKFCPMEEKSIKYSVNLFMKESGSELILLEGLGDKTIEHLQLFDPSQIPSDLLVVAVVKDGDYDQKELSRPFDIWQQMERNYIKLYQSKTTMGEDGSTWFFLVFKKRMLIEKHREIIQLENESQLFDQNVFVNRF